MAAFEVDIVDASGVPILGQFGPIVTAQFWDDEDLLDAAGQVSFDLPRSDPKSDLIADRQIVRCSTLRGGVWVAIGAGIVDTLTEDNQADQPLLLEVGANGHLIDLADRTVGSLTLNSGGSGQNPMAAASLLAAIMAYAPVGWTVTGMPSEDVYLAFSGETVLAALGKLASQLGDHFRYEFDAITGNILHWLPKSTAPVASGIRAVGNVPNPSRIGSDTCLITHLNRKRDGSKRFTRVEAFGGGNQAARLTLSGASYTLPAGYSYETETIGGEHRYWIKYDAADTIQRIDAEQTFNDVTAISTVTGHALSAANALAQTAAVWLQRHIDVYYSYDLEVTAVSQAIVPGMTIRAVYDDFSAGRRIPMVDADLVVLGAKKRLDTEGTARIVSLTLANSDRWPEDDNHLIAGTAVRTQSQSTHLQPVVRADFATTTAADVITVRYTTAAAQSIPGSTITVVNFDTMADDPSSLVTTGAGWVFTAPVTGRYRVDASVMFAATTTWALGTRNGQLYLYVNGALQSYLDYNDSREAGTAQFLLLHGSDTAYVLAGQTIQIQVRQSSSGGALQLLNSALGNYVSVALM